MNRTSHRVLAHLIAAAGLLASLATTSIARADDCVDFVDDIGPQGIDYEYVHASGGSFYFHAENGGSLVIKDDPDIPAYENPYCGSECLKLVGSGDDYHWVDFDYDGNGALPEEVGMTVFAYAGDITFDAYGAGDVWLDRQVATSNQTSYIDFDESAGIAYVTMIGGSNEDWIDHVCMDD